MLVGRLAVTILTDWGKNLKIAATPLALTALVPLRTREADAPVPIPNREDLRGAPSAPITKRLS